MNYYELLHLNRNATSEDIEKAYCVALSTYGEESIATYSILSEKGRVKILDRVKVAFDILSDEKKRAKYDRSIFKRSSLQKLKTKPVKEDMSHDESPTFTGGEYLRNVRELKGLSLRDISEKTMVRTALLAAIEEERIENLPAPVFVKGFIKAYAECLGLNPEEVLRRFDLPEL